MKATFRGDNRALVGAAEDSACGEDQEAAKTEGLAAERDQRREMDQRCGLTELDATDQKVSARTRRGQARAHEHGPSGPSVVQDGEGSNK